MNDVRLPILTITNGEETKKVCVEDVHKMCNACININDRCYNKVNKIIDELDLTLDPESYEILGNDYEGEAYRGSMIIGTGISKPCKDDVFDESLGNEIAFRKTKFKINLRKLKILGRIVKAHMEAIEQIRKYIDDKELVLNLFKDFDFLADINPDFYETREEIEKETRSED